MEEVLFALLGGPLIGVLILCYAWYCMSHGGTHIKGKGWKPKEEYPKSYLFNQIIYVTIGIGLIAWFFIKIYLGFDAFSVRR